MVAGMTNQTISAMTAARDGWLRSQGFKVLRFWNHQVMPEWEMIADTLWDELQRSSHPQPLSRGGERGEVVKRAARRGKVEERATSRSPMAMIVL